MVRLAGLRCRQIEEADIDAVAALLARGFPRMIGRFWLGAFAQLSRHSRRVDCRNMVTCWRRRHRGRRDPIRSARPYRQRRRPRPAAIFPAGMSIRRYRAYAPMLVSQALRHKDVTYLNVSPAPHTRPIIEAQGFSRYMRRRLRRPAGAQGLFGGPKTKVFEAKRQPNVPLRPARSGDAGGTRRARLPRPVVRARPARLPFRVPPAFGPRRPPCALLIYCRDIADFVRFAGPLGRALTRRGCPFVVLDANGRIPGLVRLFQPGTMPKYFKGPQPPRLGDLAYTERAVLGV